MLLPLLLLTRAAFGACDAECEEWQRRMIANRDYDNLVFTGVAGELTGGGVATRDGGPEARLFAGMVISPRGANPFLPRGHIGRAGLWGAFGPAVSLRPTALTVEGEAQFNAFAFVFGIGVRASGGALMTAATSGWMAEGGVRLVFRPGDFGLVLDASLGAEAAPVPALRGGVRLGLDWAFPWTRPPPHECRPPLPEWYAPPVGKL